MYPYLGRDHLDHHLRLLADLYQVGELLAHHGGTAGGTWHRYPATRAES